MKAHCIPAEPVQRAMEFYCADHNLDLVDLSRIIWPDSTDTSRIYKIMRQKQVEFSLADKILCRLDMEHLWRDDPELKAAYQSFDLAALDMVKPIDIPSIIEERDAKVRRTLEACNGSMAAAGRVLGVSHSLVKKVVTA